MENRAQQHRRQRMADALREEITAVLEGELRDPRIGLAAVSDVLLAANGKSARVLVQVEGDLHEGEQTIAGLNAAKGFIRHLLVEQLGLRRAPEIIFQLDRSAQQQTRVDELLHRITKRPGR